MASVARLQMRFKGQDEMFEALAQPHWRDRDWQLNLYGTGPDLEHLRRLAKFFEIAERVKFHGHVDDIRRVWAENQLLVMPSRGEGTPLAMVEAMLCGRAAVMTDVGGIREWIDEGRQGFVADAATVNSFGKALDRVWEARHRLADCGAAARAAALRNYDPEPEQTLHDAHLASSERETRAALDSTRDNRATVRAG
jgi:glycosyltransferase involved in cell wall biosynthesis